MAAALRTLALLSQERGGRSWAFLGTMHELGEESSRDHSEIGQLAENLGIDHLVSIGNSDYCRSVGSEIQTHQFQSTDDAAEMFQHFQSGDVVLVKASRAEALERLAESALVYWRTTHIGEMGETQQ
jgi:UDP-N-acetylmuramoyl-tripeptide--D-alanyl-D-alanine ligase